MTQKEADYWDLKEAIGTDSHKIVGCLDPVVETQQAAWGSLDYSDYLDPKEATPTDSLGSQGCLDYWDP